MRLDHFLLSPLASERLTDGGVDREERLRPNVFDMFQRIGGHLDREIGDRSRADELGDRACDLFR
jgi:hypothetical protein